VRVGAQLSLEVDTAAMIAGGRNTVRRHTSIVYSSVTDDGQRTGAQHKHIPIEKRESEPLGHFRIDLNLPQSQL